jgi:hypothetical protein
MQRSKRIGYFKENLSDDTSRMITSAIIDFVNALDGTKPRIKWLQEQFLTKFVSTDTAPPLTRRTRAINKWLACERNNAATNDRLLTVTPDFNILPRVEFSTFIDRVKTIIRDIVGDTIPWNYLHGGFSGGASTSHRRNCSHPARKFLGKLDVTTDASELASEVISDSPVWGNMWSQSDSILAEVSGNVLFTVPKNATIDRCAAKEPDLNMYLQRGIGNYFRDCLHQVGVNLNDQSKNRRFAWRGSLPTTHPAALDLATVDLSAASDSVTCSLVDLVMPEVIASLMGSVRSPTTMIDGDSHVNEMYSSMGNGFTFELESLLFYSIAKSVCYFGGYKGPISVYGDDIIIPRLAFHDLEYVLEFLGFSVNPEKSFYTGAFRESCGGHYYFGSDVTPFYLRKPIQTVTDLINILNQIRLWSVRGSLGIDGSDPRFPLKERAGILICPFGELWVKLSKFVPRKLFGGWDYGSRHRLASTVNGYHTLVPCQDKLRLPDGSYLFWLHLNKDRISASYDSSVQTSLEFRTTERLRMRRASRSWLPTSLAYFEEWEENEETLG